MIEMDIDITVDSLEAVTAIKRAKKSIEDRDAVHGAMATGIEESVRESIQEKKVSKEQGTKFWERVVDSIETLTDPKGGTILITETGVRLRYEGGEVRPGKNPARSGPRKGEPTAALAIPSDAVPIKRGRRLPPGRVGLLAYLTNPNGGDTVGYLVEGEEKEITRGKRKGQTRTVPKEGGSLMFTLRRVTRHKGDKSFIPDDEELIAAASKAVEGMFDDP